jgi:dephospho-CoA kinase
MAPRKLIGLTGNIATGKSNVLSEMRALGAVIIDADEVARAVQQPGQPALARILDAFGTGVFKPDGALDRRALAEVVFAERVKLKQLESIVHPAIRAEIERRLDAVPDGKVAVLEAILLFENHWAERCDQVWVTDCAPADRCQGWSHQHGLTGMKPGAGARAKPEDKVARATIVIAEVQSRTQVQVRRRLRRYRRWGVTEAPASPGTSLPKAVVSIG